MACTAHKSIRHTILLILLALAGAALLAPAANAYYSGAPSMTNPLAGHPWFVDRSRGAWFVAMRTDGAAASVLSKAANNPMGKTFGSWVPDPAVQVHDYIARAESEQPGSIPFINLARIESQACPYPGTTSGFTESEIDRWVRAFSAGIGNSRAMVIIETDKLTTIGCLPRWAQAKRYRELSYEVHLLHTRNPNSIVYIDAGSEDWGKDAATMAARLRRADVAEAQGFALGASHHDWSYKEVRFGLQISHLLHGKHYVVNTNANGWGPNAHGNSPWAASYHGGCTPPGEGLGIEPTVRTSNGYLDAFLWLGTPGFENGDCLGLGAHAAYTFYLQEAISLVRNWNQKF